MLKSIINCIFSKQHIILIAFTLACSACTPIRASFTPYNSGSILLLPPRDVVYNDKPHEAGAGSGSFMQSELVNEFSKSQFIVITTKNEEFNNIEIADIDLFFKESRKLKADYSLQIVLGEFMDSAPFTYRTDYVCMQSAIMYDTKTEEIVWQLEEPMVFEKGNIGNYLQLISKFASVISESIKFNMI